MRGRLSRCRGCRPGRETRREREDIPSDGARSNTQRRAASTTVINPKLQRYVERLNPAQRYLVGEFVENYEDGVMTRRDLIERVYRITGSVAAAAATLLAMGCAPAAAGTAAPAGATVTAPAAWKDTLDWFKKYLAG